MKFSNLKHYYHGKVRELIQLDEYHLAMITTDRISAFDRVIPNLIPGKGIILNDLTFFWLNFLKDIMPTHLVDLSDEDLVDISLNIQSDRNIQDKIGYFSDLSNRMIIVRKAEMIPLECIVRGYLYGSAWREYSETGCVNGIQTQSNLMLGSKFDEPIFTPSTKNKDGHDENISIDMAHFLVGDIVDEIAQLSLDLYRKASNYALSKGIIIADTKFEFGFVDDQITLADEVLTPDSSRFWRIEDWGEGKSIKSLDKQIVRDWLKNNGWNLEDTAPNLTDEIIQQLQSKYLDVFYALRSQKSEAIQ